LRYLDEFCADFPVAIVDLMKKYLRLQLQMEFVEKDLGRWIESASEFPHFDSPGGIQMNF